MSRESTLQAEQAFRFQRAVRAKRAAALARCAIIVRMRGAYHGRLRNGWIVWLAVLCSPVFALDRDQPLGRLFHSSWNARNGLNGSVMALAQTSDGYLWVGTTDGLYRFDGLTFERYEPERDPLPSNSVSALMAAADGGLWVGFQRGGVSFLKDGKATNYTERDGLPVSKVRHFAQDQDGTVWAAIVGGFTRLEGHRWRTIRMDWNYPDKSAWTTFIDSQGTLWVASGSRILFLRKGEKKFQDSGVPVGTAYAVIQARDGTIWFTDGEHDSVRALRPPTNLEGSRNSPSLLTKIPARAMLFDRDGALWLAGNELVRVPFPERLGGRMVAKPGPEVETFNEKQGLTDNSTETILEDREGNIWVGTDGGLDRFRHRNIRWFPFSEGTRSISMVAGDHGDVWAAQNGDHPQSMLRIQDGKFANGGPQEAFTTYRDPDGSIWISSSNSLFHWKGGMFSKVAMPEEALRMHAASPKDPIIISSITKDRSGCLWVAIGGLGEFQFKDETWKFAPILRDHPDWSAGYAFTDAADRVWLTWGEIASIIDHGRIRSFTAQEIPVSPFRVVAGRDREVWVGGERGVAFFAGDRFHVLKASGNGFGSITGIVAPSNDGLWVSAAAGIVHISQGEIQHALEQDDYKVNYEVFDLISDLPEQLQREGTYSSGAIQSTDGLLWFATRGGAARIDPAHIFRNPLPPPVVIRSVIADGSTYYPSSAEMILPALTKRLQIDYTALSLSIPERVRFRYKLEGSDKDWQDAGGRRQAFYTNPKPGPYRFQVLACNNDGVWNETGASFEFRVAPAFYQTIWFQGLYWATGGAIVWLFYLYRLKQATAQMHGRLEERLAERSRMARDLHDTLLQSFQGLMLHLEVVNQLLPQGKAKDELGKSLVRADRAIEEGRTAVYDLRSSAIATSDLPESIKALGDELSAEGAATFRLVVEGPPRDVQTMIRDELYRITREALQNAFHHSHAGHIEAEIAYGERALRLRIRDDGNGIPQEILEQGGRPGHYGLPGMRERAEQIGGKLQIWSGAGAGTEIELNLDGSIVYSAPTRGSRFRWFRRKV